MNPEDRFAWLLPLSLFILAISIAVLVVVVSYQILVQGLHP